MKPRVLNLHDKSVIADGEKIAYVGRPTKWGNPMTVREIKELHKDRYLSDKEVNQLAVDWYREYLKHRPELVEAVIRELRGKDLACWCAPLPCHAGVLLEVANE